MRTMLRASIDVEAGNRAIKDGRFGAVMEPLMATLKPEAAYFFTDHGKRTFIAVFDLKSPSQIPVIAEPLFMNANAEVEFIPVMNADDLQAGLAEHARKG